MPRLVLAVVAMILVSACAQTKPAAPKPAIRSVAIIPATNPMQYSLENVSALQFVIPLAATFNYLDSKEKAKTFNATLSVQPLNLGATLTEEVAAALRGYGYQVQVLDNVLRPAGDADNVDYAKIATSADSVLHLRFTEIGLFSARSSASYLPRVDAYATLFVKGRSDYLYDEEIYWGADASKNTATTIPSDEKFAFSGFDIVMLNMEDVRTAFDTGARAVGQRMAQQIHASMK